MLDPSHQCSQDRYRCPAYFTHLLIRDLRNTAVAGDWARMERCSAAPHSVDLRVDDHAQDWATREECSAAAGLPVYGTRCESTQCDLGACGVFDLQA